MDKELKVLAVPAARGLGGKIGATASIAYHLLSAPNTKFYAIVDYVGGRVDLPRNVEIIEIGSNSAWSNQMYVLRCLKHARKLLKEEKIDIIHHMMPFAYRNSFNPLSLFGITKDYPFVVGPAEIPHVFYEDDYTAYHGEKSGLIIYYLMRMLKKRTGEGKFLLDYLSAKTAKDCDILVAVDEETKRKFSKIISSKKIRVIPHGVDLGEFKYSPFQPNHNIMTVGSLIKRKGFDYVIKAMPRVLEDYSDAKLHIVSDGPRREILERLAKELNVDKRVVFQGKVSNEELKEFYKNCRVFCAPYLSHGFSIANLEAMATGRPVVATNINANNMVEDGNTGFLVPVTDEDAIADAILKIFGDDELAHKMGAEGRKKVEGKYDWRKIAKEYRKVYGILS